jgi:hypothetical protein
LKLAALVPAVATVRPNLVPGCAPPQAGTPTRSAPVGWRMYRLDAEAAAHNQLEDQRVRVPHLACLGLVASPDRRGHIGH